MFGRFCQFVSLNKTPLNIADPLGSEKPHISDPALCMGYTTAGVFSALE